MKIKSLIISILFIIAMTFLIANSMEHINSTLVNYNIFTIIFCDWFYRLNAGQFIAVFIIAIIIYITGSNIERRLENV